ncbi:L,D-transpeptidase [Methylobacterium sp. Leaf465]|uniref:L,D-transpeptidase n=1 Tax=Methylobacterium sp. Leaf465 TaxID=1736385 RepID=UPI0009EC43D9|nr:L,D-transpeptidase [Methylobacterium sp. Leaf465]
MRSRLTSLVSGFALATFLTCPAWAEVLIAVDKDAQRMTVTVDGRTRYDWPVSTGVDGYDTPSGAHRPFRMERTHFSREFDDAPMPNAIFFTGQGHAIHGTNHTRRLGSAASHGCVRLAPKNAATLFSIVKAEGMGKTRVVIEGSSVMASRRRRGDGDGVMSAGMQMGREPSAAYRPAVAVGLVSRRAPVYDFREPAGDGDAYFVGDGLD